MSDVIRLNLKKGALKVKFKSEGDDFEDAREQQQQQEDSYRKQLQAYYEKGYAEGQQETAAELEREYSARLMEKTEEFSRILQSIERNLSDYESAFDRIVIEVVTAMTEKIIKREANLQSFITETLREAVRKVLGADEIIIRLHPDDLQEINSAGGELMLDESFSKIKFEADAKIDRGGCMVETEVGNVDARINTQLNELKKQLDVHFGGNS